MSLKACSGVPNRMPSSENPDINVPPSTNEPNESIKIADLVDRPAAGADDTKLGQSGNRLRAHQKHKIKESAG